MLFATFPIQQTCAVPVVAYVSYPGYAPARTFSCLEFFQVPEMWGL